MKIKVDPRTGIIKYKDKIPVVANNATVVAQKLKVVHHGQQNDSKQQNIDLNQVKAIAETIGQSIASNISNVLKFSTFTEKEKESISLIKIDESLIDVNLEDKQELKRGNSSKSLAESHIAKDMDLEKSKTKLRELKSGRR